MLLFQIISVMPFIPFFNMVTLVSIVAQGSGMPHFVTRTAYSESAEIRE